ncbi:MAG TPA: DUF4168 domain-containing protein [Rhodanobacteraceae bacterium]|jgi:hypothetical protein|nr:DUF4168 domain-containing protein [Rhodanobacteraceae bacterium]
MTGRLKRSGAAAAVTLGIAMLAPAALAQTQPATPQQAPAQDSAATPQTGPAPSDAELKQFAGAAVDVQGIRQSLQPQLESAQTADARTKLKASAEKKMEAAVRSHQLSLQRYVQIANLVQTDSTIRAKVQKLMPPQQPSQS